ncbi:MAG: hypothetical protein C4526_10475 [Nitrospiraceae bacterium]|nr:MAG: hypothetical protein C4526_10475 [Nitrospiraceae bacterium]
MIKYITNASGDWVTKDIAPLKNQLLSTKSVRADTAIAVDSNDKVHIAFFEASENITDADGGDLRYATNASGVWELTTIDNDGKVGEYCSMAIDSRDKLHISYYDKDNSDLKYASNVSGTWVISTVDMEGSSGSHSAIAVDSRDKVHISYYDFSDNGLLKYATNTTGAWVVTWVDTDYSFSSTGRNTSLALDTSDRVHIAYYGMPQGSGEAIVKYANNVPPVFNISGVWYYSTFNNIGYGCPADADETGTFTGTQTGNVISGRMTAEQYVGAGRAGGTTYNISSTFPENGGVTKMNVSFDIYSDSSGSGKVSWFWWHPTGIISCSGKGDVSLTKVSQ